MCPLCWATALATCGGLLAVSILTIAMTDFWTFAAAMVLGAASVVHKAGFEQVPWWVFVLLLIVAVGRVVYVAAFDHRRLLAVSVWKRACLVAARRCPNRDA